MINCIITGVGGQGTVLLARLIGTTAIDEGYNVRGTETIGMAQRGGSVISHIRMGETIHSPLIPHGKADLIIALEPSEAVRTYPFLAKDGVMVVLDKPIIPVTGSLNNSNYTKDEMVTFLKKHVKELIIIDTEELIEQCGSAKVTNVALLGVAIEAGYLPFNMEKIKQVIESRIPEKFQELNFNALTVGTNIANNYETCEG